MSQNSDFVAYPAAGANATDVGVSVFATATTPAGVRSRSAAPGRFPSPAFVAQLIPFPGAITRRYAVFSRQSGIELRAGDVSASGRVQRPAGVSLLNQAQDLQNVRPHPDHDVLVIEDNEHTAHMLEFILERTGYQVRVLSDGRAAREFIESSPPPDAVLLDLMLPYVSGEELISVIRESTEWRYVPILVVSGRVLEQDVVHAFELGVNDYVTKPFRPAELLVRLKRLIETRESLLFQTQSQAT